MESFEVSAELRDGSGKTAARRLRREGLVPAVLYGGERDPRNLALVSHHIEKQLENEAFYSHILKVSAGGESANAVLKGLQRDPASGRVIHLDFQRVKMSEKLVIRVPLHFINEDASPGHKAGGIVNALENDLEVSCMPANLPEYIEVDLTGLEVGDAISLSQIKLPADVELAHAIEDSEHDHNVVSIERAYEMATEPTEAEGEAVDGDAAEAPAEKDDAS